jgi:hypothetical protein
MFSGERLFTVKLANGADYHGIAPRHFCWNERGEIVGEYEPTRENEGKIAARVVDELEDGQVAVEVPNGEVIAVDRSDVVKRPTVIRPPTPTPPTESATNVSVGS